MTRYGAIVIGSGSAGLFTAIELQRHLPVVIVTKAAIADANTNWAQGGIAAAVGAFDSPEQHLADTLAAGAGLVDEEAARVLCSEGPLAIAELTRHGVQFDFSDGSIALAREAAHSVSRVLHSGGDQTGAEIERALAEESRRYDIETRTGAFVTRILVESGGARGVQLVAGGIYEELEAEAVVIATGGAGQLFQYTTNPAVATADGVALAFQAGAELADLEFFQFHPTALRLAGQRPFLISEAVRGEGALLRNAAGEAFMHRYHPRAELAPRDIVSRAIVAEMRATGDPCAYLDCTGLHEVDVELRFPSIFAFCLEAGLDIRRDPIPVAPAAHYFMGGVRTDTWGRSTVPRLYACGEAAATGVHGANRLASNSLLETVVFARRVATSIRQADFKDCPADAEAITVPEPVGTLDRTALQSLLWERVGIQRTGSGLAAAADVLDRAPIPPTPESTIAARESRNMTLTARLIVEAAQTRTESRGAHYRSDFPERDDVHWHRRLSVRRVGR